MDPRLIDDMARQMTAVENCGLRARVLDRLTDRVDPAISPTLVVSAALVLGVVVVLRWPTETRQESVPASTMATTDARTAPESPSITAGYPTDPPISSGSVAARVPPASREAKSLPRVFVAPHASAPGFDPVQPLTLEIPLLDAAPLESGQPLTVPPLMSVTPIGASEQTGDS